MIKQVNLNGWQRLWVILAVLLLIPAGLVGFDTRPTADAINREWAGKVIELAANNDPALAGQEPWKIAIQYQDVPPAKLVEKLNYGYLSRHPELKERADALGQPFQQQLDRLPLSAITHFVLVIFGWLLVAGMLYLCGFAIGWVYRGFRPAITA